MLSEFHGKTWQVAFKHNGLYQNVVFEGMQRSGFDLEGGPPLFPAGPLGPPYSLTWVLCLSCIAPLTFHTVF